nr:TetR/AcrR family transcriptional regulator [Desulfobacterales bacterium]
MKNAKKNNSNRPSKLGPKAQKTKGIILQAMRELLGEKEFISITTAEIAARAGVNEASIYHYFEGKTDLLYTVLEQFALDFVEFMELNTKGLKGAMIKLRKAIWSNIYFLLKEKTFAKIFFLEVRNNPNYFKSRAYAVTRKHSAFYLSLIKEGISSGEIRSTISPYALRNIIFGAVEYALLPWVIFGKEVSADTLTDEICDIIFYDIRRENDLVVRLQEQIKSVEAEINALRLQSLNITQELKNIMDRIPEGSGS